MNNANIGNEVRRTNVRWAMPFVGCFVAVLLLAAACQNVGVEEQQNAQAQAEARAAEEQRIREAQLAEQEAEARAAEEQRIKEQQLAELIAEQVSAWTKCRATTPYYYSATELTDEHIHEVRLKYDSILTEHASYVLGIREGSLYSAGTGHLDQRGIVIYIPPVKDPDHASGQFGIPSCLEGVPIQVVNSPLPDTIEQTEAAPPAEWPAVARSIEPIWGDRLREAARACMAESPDFVTEEYIRRKNLELGEGRWIQTVNTSEHTEYVEDKYGDLLMKHPYAEWTNTGTLREYPYTMAIYPGRLKDVDRDEVLMPAEDGEMREVRVVEVNVRRVVDQRDLPAGQRIPSCLEGVPVQIIKGYVFTY